MFAAILTCLRGLLQRRRVARELDDELRFHVEMEIQSNIERGMSPVEARRLALRDLGGVDQTKGAVRDVRATWVDAANEGRIGVIQRAPDVLGQKHTIVATDTPFRGVEQPTADRPDSAQQLE